MSMMKKYHLIGIGGIGMSGIARLMAGRGVRVSGSDAKQSRITDELTALGCAIHIGHRAENIGDCDTVVYSSAIKEDNPEMKEARRRGLPVCRSRWSPRPTRAGRGSCRSPANGSACRTGWRRGPAPRHSCAH